MPSPLLTRWLSAFLPVVPCIALTACGGSRGGGSGDSGGFASSAQLLSVSFPDPVGVNPESLNQPPANAPLVQSLEFVFSSRPNPATVNADTITIRDPAGFPVEGRFDVEGTTVTFTPRLPLEPAVQSAGGTWTSNGGAGLEPGTVYTVRLGSRTWPFISSVAVTLTATFPDPADSRGILFTFKTTTDGTRFWKGVPRRSPRLVRTDPADGSSGVTPELYTDPEGLFAARRAFYLEFDGPLNPHALNIGRFKVVDLDDRSVGPAGLTLGADARLVSNELDGAVVEVMPSGILPLGHMLSLEYPEQLRGLSQGNNADAPTRVAATLQVANTNEPVISDILYEAFDDVSRADLSNVEVPLGDIPADWDVNDSNVLEPALGFRGAGELGRFIPQAGADPVTVFLDTTRQVFPLLDGSTPEAPSVEVLGGVFAFTDVVIPSGVTLVPRGPNPLVITATGTVSIAGTILVAGQNGPDENAFDSGITSNPGGPAGAGGGRGGEGNPLVYRGGIVSPLNLIAPPAGGDGFGPGNAARIGGRGGQSGVEDHPDAFGLYSTDNEMDCNELNDGHNTGYKAPGGGGASFLGVGTPPRSHGNGNVITDGQGGYIVRTPATHGPNYDLLVGGGPGDPVFVTPSVDDDFIGSRGELREIQGGQGGGAGGGALDGYYCGSWCTQDANPANDGVCVYEVGPLGTPQMFADSVVNARGGSGGGGGGAFLVEALGPIVLETTGAIDAHGGNGGGGEQISCGNYSGGGGAASGGAIVLRSATSIQLKSQSTLDVTGGQGAKATSLINAMTSCTKYTKNNPGAGGDAANGIIQLQVPAGQTAVVQTTDITTSSWVDPMNVLNPAEFSTRSLAVSEWYDLGRTIQRPPQGTNPAFRFRGLDKNGFVKTDPDGSIPNPGQVDIRVDYFGMPDPEIPGKFLPGQEPRSNFIPPNASVQLEFQGADAIAPGSKEVDPATITPWTPTPTVADGMQFLRYRLTFDINKDTGQLQADLPRPTVQSLSIHVDF